MPRKSANSEAPKVPTLKKGQYPTGRMIPEKARREIYAMARAHAAEAIETIYGIMTDKDLDPSHRLAAAKELLNRGVGTAASVEITEKVFKIEHVFNEDKIKQMTDEEIQQGLAFWQRVITDPDDAEIIEHRP